MWRQTLHRGKGWRTRLLRGKAALLKTAPDVDAADLWRT